MLSKSKVMDLYIEISNAVSISSVADAIKSQMIYIESIEVVKPAYGNEVTIAAIMTIRLKQKSVKLDVISNICEIKGVEFAEEI
jgi:ribosome-interacting GTPase 1